MDDTLGDKLTKEDDSVKGLASTANFSLREPLEAGPPHPLLGSFNSLLTSLLIPLELTSLALVTPTLALNVLEALLETRIIDVPDDHRGSWERTKRTKVAQVVLQAMRQVTEGLARAQGGEREVKWRLEEIQVRRIVRGNEEELAKLVQGLLRIAGEFGIEFDVPRRTKEPQQAVTTLMRSAEEQVGTSVSTREKPAKTPSSMQVQGNSPRNPSLLFATRPIRQQHSVPPSSSSHAFESSTSSVSSYTSRSTDLTRPHPRPHIRPSLSTELERSGTLFSPPKMPGSPHRHRQLFGIQNPSEESNCGGKRKVRSMLKLMRDRENGKVEEQLEVEEPGGRAFDRRKGKEKEVEDDFSTPRKGPGTRNLNLEAQSRDDRLNQASVEDPGATGRRERATLPVNSRESSTKIKARATGTVGERSGQRASQKVHVAKTSQARPSSSSEAESCLRCRTQLSRGTEQDPMTSSANISLNRRPRGRDKDKDLMSSSPPRTETDLNQGKRTATWCRCLPDTGESSRPGSIHVEEEEEGEKSEDEERLSSSPTLVKIRKGKNPAVRKAKPYNERIKKPPEQTPASVTVSPARRIRTVRVTRGYADKPLLESEREAGFLSVHGESEIELFENTLRGAESFPVTNNSDSLAAPPFSAPSMVNQHDDKVTTSTPSPYTMLLLAQRARLAEKLRALELRERDRSLARRMADGDAQD